MSKSHYYRMIDVSIELFEQWLNLPKGFTFDVAQYDFEKRLLLLRVACPKSPKYAVNELEVIPVVTPLAKITAKGRMRVWHPDLGQKEPKR